ncbi:hypothetical protein DFA_01975 [Cavenderia fasciculata]|uniref:SAM domain-containing protein n=1 Tax=Cavenderia fasciculata TaxID=261658 RepID=F4PR28_CACFS|nr:uncharacterized protein DFA_01975 [Cavenderia fasciculata]EGG22085.1 hypothetical protein DFA_01975 [Cavenderia fasciculata]|eukprot:XP_004359936.1 hypothetical protein DFA_01975 [Cavenderia fasciculata]
MIQPHINLDKKIVLEDFMQWTEEDVQIWLRTVVEDGDLYADMISSQRVKGKDLCNLTYERLIQHPFNLIGGYALRLERQIKDLKYNYYKSVGLDYYEKVKGALYTGYSIGYKYSSIVYKYLPSIPLDRILKRNQQSLPTTNPILESTADINANGSENYRNSFDSLATSSSNFSSPFSMAQDHNVTPIEPQVFHSEYHNPPPIPQQQEESNIHNHSAIVGEVAPQHQYYEQQQQQPSFTTTQQPQQPLF